MQKDLATKEPRGAAKNATKEGSSKGSKVEPERDPLMSKVIEVFQLPKNFTAKITYQGVHSGTEPLDPNMGTEVSTPDDITSLNLDTRFTHLFHVNEWKIVVKIETIWATTERELLSSDTVAAILTQVQEQTGIKNMLLYHNKIKLQKSDSIGSICQGATCHLVALDPKSEEQRSKFLS